MAEATPTRNRTQPVPGTTTAAAVVGRPSQAARAFRAMPTKAANPQVLVLSGSVAIGGVRRCMERLPVHRAGRSIDVLALSDAQIFVSSQKGTLIVERQPGRPTGMLGSQAARFRHNDDDTTALHNPP